MASTITLPRHPINPHAREVDVRWCITLLPYREVIAGELSVHIRLPVDREFLRRTCLQNEFSGNLINLWYHPDIPECCNPFNCYIILLQSTHRGLSRGFCHQNKNSWWMYYSRSKIKHARGTTWQYAWTTGCFFWLVPPRKVLSVEDDKFPTKKVKVRV